MGRGKRKRVIGVAQWLIAGKRLVDRIHSTVQNELGGAALRQSVMDFEPSERAEAAAAIREAGLVLTYHGNVQHKLKNGKLDEDFVARVIDDVLWWHEN